MRTIKFIAKPLTITLMGLSVLSANAYAGSANGAFTEISMFSAADYKKPLKCIDDYITLDDGTLLTFVKVYDDGLKFPTKLGTGQFDKYRIYKPKNAWSVTVAASTLQANHTYTATFTSTNYKTVEEYKSAESLFPARTHISENIGIDNAEVAYLYLGIPANETNQSMVLSNVTASYFVRDTSCAEIKAGIVGLATPAKQDPITDENDTQDDEDEEVVVEVKPHTYSPETGVLMDENYNFHINNINVDTPDSVEVIGADFEFVRNEDGSIFKRAGDTDGVAYFRMSNIYKASADYDGDDVTVAEGDCDDNDGAVYPGADETDSDENLNCVIELKTPS